MRKRTMRQTVALAAVALVWAVLAVGGAGRADAATATPLVLPQGDAFAVLGHSCGGIQEKTYATGFDSTTGFPTGDVYASTSCGGSGRGGGYHTTTYTAWITVTWDWDAVVFSYGAAGAPTVDPSLDQFDANGNEVYNSSSNAYLVLAPSFTPVPVVTGLSVSEGPSSGGTTVTITGADLAFASVVDFGTGVPAASFTITNDTSIAAVTPSTANGTVDVTVGSAGGTSATSSADQFTFVAPPVVIQLTPASGPWTGGTTVVISGQNFTGASAVQFGGGNFASFTVDSDTQITASTPNIGGVDTENVTVTTVGGTSAPTNGDVFSFTRSDFIAVAPSSGAPGQNVMVTGAGFAPGEQVKVKYKTGLASPRTVLLCTAPATGDGSFSCSATIPTADAGAVGAHTIRAKGASSLVSFTTTFSLT